MNKSYIKFLVLLMLSLRGEMVSADTGRFGGSFFGFGKNKIEGVDISHKELLRQRQMDKAANRNNEKRTGLANQERGKELNKQNVDGTNVAVKKNRLTPDERRALRRQIHDAGSDLYVPPK